MVCLSAGDRASHLAISSLQRSTVFGMPSELYCCMLLPPSGTSIHSYIVPLVDRNGETGKNGAAI